MSVIDILNDNVVDKEGNKIDLKDCKAKYIGLYFSAHWCSPCKAFTPILIEFYNKYKEEKDFEIIFISFDSDEESFKKYYEEMPWWTLTYVEESEIKDTVSEKFRVTGIPAFVILDAQTGDVVCRDARSKIQTQDPDGINFPWK